jgi:hypothetical protein
MPEPNRVRISFDYYPENPDPEDPTGMSNDEYDTVMDILSQLGADNPTIERQED